MSDNASVHEDTCHTHMNSTEEVSRHITHLKSLDQGTSSVKPKYIRY